MLVVEGLKDLPSQPLLKPDLVGGVFLTIWVFLAIFLSVLLLRLFWSRRALARPEYTIFIWGTCFLFLYYLSTGTDRWLHFEERKVPYSYVFLDPGTEVLRVISTLCYLWGTWALVHEDRKGIYTKKAEARWWFSANIAISAVILLSFYYVALNLTFAWSWLNFYSMNVIDDIATKRNSFRLAMAGGFFVLAIVDLVAAGHNILQSEKHQGGRGRGRDTRFPSRYRLAAAALFLWARCLVEFILANARSQHFMSPESIGRLFDITYGLFSVFFLVFILLLARLVFSPENTHGRGARQARENVHQAIICKLEELTQNRRLTNVPKFPEVLDEVRLDFENPARVRRPEPGVKMAPRVDDGTGLTREDALGHAVARLNELRADPQPWVNPEDRNRPPVEEEARATRIWGTFRSLMSLRSKMTPSPPATNGGPRNGGAARDSRYDGIERVDENIPMNSFSPRHSPLDLRNINRGPSVATSAGQTSFFPRTGGNNSFQPPPPSDAGESSFGNSGAPTYGGRGGGGGGGGYDRRGYQSHDPEVTRFGSIPSYQTIAPTPGSQISRDDWQRDQTRSVSPQGPFVPQSNMYTQQSPHGGQYGPPTAQNRQYQPTQQQQQQQQWQQPNDTSWAPSAAARSPQPSSQVPARRQVGANRPQPPSPTSQPGPSSPSSPSRRRNRGGSSSGGGSGGGGPRQTTSTAAAAAATPSPASDYMYAAAGGPSPSTLVGSMTPMAPPGPSGPPSGGGGGLRMRQPDAFRSLSADNLLPQQQTHATNGPGVTSSPLASTELGYGFGQGHSSPPHGENFGSYDQQGVNPDNEKR